MSRRQRGATTVFGYFRDRHDTVGAPNLPHDFYNARLFTVAQILKVLSSISMI